MSRSRSRRNSRRDHDADFYRVVDSYRQPRKVTIPNVEKRVKAILHESAKQNVQESNPVHDAMSHRISALFGTGSDAVLVKEEITRLEKSEVSEMNRLSASSLASDIPSKLPHEHSIFDSTASHRSYLSHAALNSPSASPVNPRWHDTTQSYMNNFTTRYAKPDLSPMTSVTASAILDRAPGGKYHIPDEPLPYVEKYEAKPQESIYTTTTPKMWPSSGNTNWSSSATAPARCSKNDLRKEKTLSSLQATLLSSTDLPSHLQSSLQQATSTALKHAQWLHKQNQPATGVAGIESSLSTITLPTTTTTSKKSKRSSTSKPQAKTYDAELSKYVGLNLVDTSKNPYRSSLYTSTTTGSKIKDPKQYSKQTSITSFGRYTVTRNQYNCFNPSSSASQPPSKEFISRVLGQVTRRLMVSYDTKIIEVGATLKALQDLRHPTPGVAAIIDLHRGFIDISILNPNNWFISRTQFATVLREKVPWLDESVVGRLISAFDPHASGLIKYVTVTSVLMMGNRPAMTQLIALLRRETSSSNDKHGTPFLLRLIHGLYEDCEGGVEDTLVKDNNSSTAQRIDRKGMGMRLEDVSESLLCCACSIEDELTMSKLAQEVTQDLFEAGQQTDPITNKEPPHTATSNASLRDFSVTARQSVSSSQDNWSSVKSESTTTTLPLATTYRRDVPQASVVLKHQKLKSVKHIPRVAQEDYVSAIMNNKRVLTEFTAQLTRFRELLMPYTVKGSISYKESLVNNVGYGSKKSAPDVL